MATNVVCKICKVYPAKNKRITGILPNQGVITDPGIYHLNLKEIRRCMSYADVFEVVTGGDVLLHENNYMLDNSKATVTPAEKVPEMKDKTIHYGVHKPAEAKEDSSTSSPSAPKNEDEQTTSSADSVSSQSAQTEKSTASETKTAKNSSKNSNTSSK